MRFQKISLGFLFASLVLVFGCPSGNTTKDNKNENSENVKTNKPLKTKSNTNNPLDAKKTPPPKTVNKAETIKPVVKAYCDAIRTKDNAALTKVYSKATLRQLQRDMREDGAKSIVEYLSSEPVGNNCAVRNEKINGNTAVALVTTKTYPNGIELKFVKENGSWKMTDQSSDFDAVGKPSGK